MTLWALANTSEFVTKITINTRESLKQPANTVERAKQSVALSNENK